MRGAPVRISVRSTRAMWACVQGDATLEDRWYSVDEISHYLGVKRDTVYKWINRRGMPAHKLGRLWKFKKTEVDEWVFAHDEWTQAPPTSARDASSCVQSSS